jgi:hypothetical protein
LRLPAGKPERLVGGTSLEAPRFSPSGQWIAWLGNDAAHVISLHGGAPVTLSKASRTQWLPGRDDLLTEDDDGLRLFIASNGFRAATRQIPGANLPAVCSPNGSEIIYGDIVTRTGRLCRLAPDQAGSAESVLVSKPLSALIPAAWMANGILYWEDPDFSASIMADGLELRRISAQSPGVSTLLHEDTLAPSPDHTRLAISAGAGRYHWAEKRIAIVDPNTAGVRYLTDKSVAAVFPSWSPDGGRIAFSAAPSPANSARLGGGEPARRLLAARRIFVTGLAKPDAPKQLTDDSRYRDEKPMWSADGSRILFCRIDSGNNRTLWLMDSENASPAQVTGPLHANSGLPGEEGAWFGYYGYIDWRAMVDWSRQ